MDKLTVFGTPEQGAVEQIENVLQDERAVRGALMADNHKGYSMPIGGVVAYEDAISPSGVGFDIACGNKAVRTNLTLDDFNLPAIRGDGHVTNRRYIDTFKPFMRQVQKTVSFGIGRSNPEPIDHALFDNPLWTEIERLFGSGLKAKAADQLGTVGSGNHYVDLLVDETGNLWIANHFGSRGLGHTIASGFMSVAYGGDWQDRLPEREDPAVLDTTTDVGQFYIEAMNLAGEYAYAGRDYVAEQVARIFGAEILEEVHNHHNFAWLEDGKWVVRKGATPLTPEPAFIGGSMGDVSVVVRQKEIVIAGDQQRVENEIRMIFQTAMKALNSAPHGAGRIMSRNAAAGKLRKMWYCNNRNCNQQPWRAIGNTHPGSICPTCKHRSIRKMRMRDTSNAAIDWPAVRYSLEQRGIVVLGAGADEAPGVYKNLTEVIAAHNNIEVLHTLRPLGVVMAGSDEFDPYKD